MITAFVGPLDPLSFHLEAIASATFTDPDAGDTFSAVLDWGDGAVSQPVPTSVGGGEFTITDGHFYTEPGIYTLTLTVTDAAGAFAVETFEYAVMFDPAGRKILGSVRVTEGTEQHLGVHVKPARQTGIPEGNVKYNFDGSGFADGLEAQEIDYIWIFGNWGITGGTARIDGEGDYEFFVTAVDDSKSGGVDAFRVKVWVAGDPENVVFDTQPGADTYAAPTTVPDTGNIVVR